MNTAKLLEAIERKLQDASYKPEDLLATLNQGLVFIAYQHPLPLLETTDTVTSVDGKTQVDMPSDYHTRLLFALNKTTGDECRICYTRQTLRRMYDHELSKQGDIVDVAVEGKTLHYRREPAGSQDIELTYYAYPEELTEDEDSIPECIPEALHHQLLVNYVLWDKFSEIEDGIEGQKVNTEYYAGQYATGMQMLQAYYPDASKPRRYYPRTIKTF